MERTLHIRERTLPLWSGRSPLKSGRSACTCLVLQAAAHLRMLLQLLHYLILLSAEFPPSFMTKEEWLHSSSPLLKKEQSSVLEGSKEGWAI